MDHSHYKHVSSLRIKYFYVFSQEGFLGDCSFAGGKVGFLFFFFLWNVLSRTLRQDLRVSFSYMTRMLCFCAPKPGFSLDEATISMQNQAAEGIGTVSLPVSPMHMLESAAAKLWLILELVSSCMSQ